MLKEKCIWSYRPRTWHRAVQNVEQLQNPEHKRLQEFNLKWNSPGLPTMLGFTGKTAASQRPGFTVLDHPLPNFPDSALYDFLKLKKYLFRHHCVIPQPAQTILSHGCICKTSAHLHECGDWQSGLSGEFTAQRWKKKHLFYVNICTLFQAKVQKNRMHYFSALPCIYMLHMPPFNHFLLSLALLFETQEDTSTQPGKQCHTCSQIYK